jgi:hypothetical protein
VDGQLDLFSNLSRQAKTQQGEGFAGITAAAMAQLESAAAGAAARVALLQSVNPLGPEVEMLVWNHVRRDGELEVKMVNIAEQLDESNTRFERKTELQLEQAVAQLMSQSSQLQHSQGSSRGTGASRASSRGSARGSAQLSVGLGGEVAGGTRDDGQDAGSQHQEGQDSGRRQQDDDDGGEGIAPAAAGVEQLLAVLSRAGGSRVAPFAVSLHELVSHMSVLSLWENRW